MDSYSSILHRLPSSRCLWRPQKRPAILCTICCFRGDLKNRVDIRDTLYNRKINPNMFVIATSLRAHRERFVVTPCGVSFDYECTPIFLPGFAPAPLLSFLFDKACAGGEDLEPLRIVFGHTSGFIVPDRQDYHNQWPG